MKVQVYFKRFQQIHLLIQRGSATSPQQLAKSLSLSEPALYRYLKVLKEYGAPIAYCRKRKKYYYNDPNLRWEDLKF